MKKEYNITITFDGLSEDFKMELRELFKKYEVEFTINNLVNIKNADKNLIDLFNQWDLRFKENI